MDPLLAEITARQNGYKFGPEKGDCTESLCYADDNALCTNSPAEMNSYWRPLPPSVIKLDAAQHQKVGLLHHYSMWE